MNKKVSPTLIGAFVVGALALVVIAILALSAGRLFRETKEFVLYFEESVNGLRVGAPVKFKGVEVGSVKEILLQLEQDMKIQNIPVIIEVELEKITKRGATGVMLKDPQVFKTAIDQGLRGQLQMESVVTGLLYIGLDILPGSPAHFAQASEERYTYQEIPTTPTTLQKAEDTAIQVLAKLETIDFKGLIDSLTEAVNSINRVASSPELESTLASLERTTKQTAETMKETEATMARVRAAIDPDSPTFYELTRTLKEVSAASRSLRLLTNYVERNPRAIIFGKPATKEE